MDCNIKKEENEIKIINIQKEENIKMKLDKKNFNFELSAVIEINKGYNSYIKKVLELPGDRIGILYQIMYEKCLFYIYSSKIFKRITEFKNDFLDAIRIGDSSLALCDNNNIYLYKLINKEYELIQKIECYKKEEENHSFSKNYSYDTEIKFLYPLINEDLMACSYYDIKLYKKEKGKYLFCKSIVNEYFIKNIIETQPNTLVLFSMKTIGRGCLINGYMNYISLYNLQNDEKKILSENFSFHDGYEKYQISRLQKIDHLLFAIYEGCLDIYDIQQNMKLINESDYIIMEGIGLYKRKKIPFKYFKIWINNNFILAEDWDGKSFLYKYEDKSFKKYEEFPFNLKEAGIMKLKKNKLIIYSNDKIKVINSKTFLIKI